MRNTRYVLSIFLFFILFLSMFGCTQLIGTYKTMITNKTTNQDKETSNWANATNKNVTEIAVTPNNDDTPPPLPDSGQDDETGAQTNDDELPPFPQ